MSSEFGAVVPVVHPGPQGRMRPARRRAPISAAVRPRVLVVDDQLDMAEMLAEGLDERGYDAIAVRLERRSRAAARGRDASTRW